MELSGVGTIKSIGFSKFGLGFGGFCGALEQFADIFRKFLSFGRKWQFFGSVLIHCFDMCGIRSGFVCGCHRCGNGFVDVDISCLLRVTCGMWNAIAE